MKYFYKAIPYATYLVAPKLWEDYEIIGYTLSVRGGVTIELRKAK